MAIGLALLKRAPQKTPDLRVVTDHPVTTQPSVRKREVAPEKPDGAFPTKVVRLQTHIDDEIEEVKQILESHDLNENVYLREYAHMFDRLVRIRDKYEDKCIEGNKSADVYALVQVLNQLREIIADVRSVADTSRQSERLVQDVLRPTFSDIAQNTADLTFLIKQAARERLTGTEFQEFVGKLDILFREHGRFLQACYHRASDQTSAVLRA